MKRAAMVFFAVALLVLLGLPSVPNSDSSCYASTALTTGSHAGPSSGGKIVPGGETTGGPAGGGSGGGGTDQGDADGLSGYKNAPPNGRILGSEGMTTRVRVFAEMWWQFMVLIRL
jgi:hypothetical protein